MNIRRYCCPFKFSHKTDIIVKLFCIIGKISVAIINLIM